MHLVLSQCFVSKLEGVSSHVAEMGAMMAWITDRVNNESKDQIVTGACENDES